MNVEQTIGGMLRGARASALLKSLGIDARRYWLLVDLFGQLSERGEMLDQLGTNGVALKVAAWMYGACSAFVAVVFLMGHPPVATYLSTFLVLTAFLLFTVLLSETGNSLVNPVESLVLAHQPVDGATYTAAKLTHLARIVLYLVPAINGVPAMAGLMAKGAEWFDPFLHLFAALGIGLVAGLLCCAVYGWLIRLVPAGRLKAAGQLAGAMPFLAMIWWQPLRNTLARAEISGWAPARPAARWGLVAALGVAAVGVVIFGIRSLSADYLIRVSAIVHGGRAKSHAARRSWTAGIVARFFGGQPARAGFVYVSRMMRRDFQFRRQAAPTVVLMLLGWVPMMAQGWRTDPFSGRFTMAHLLPHLFGFLLFFLCTLLPYGNDFKAAWTFLIAPAQAFARFAKGVHAALFITLIVVPHAIAFAAFAWRWGLWRAGLFTAYSMAVSSVYLAVELRLVKSVPFTVQADPARGAAMLPLMLLGALGMGAAVGVQHFVLFRSPAAVAAGTVVAGVAAYLLTQNSLRAVESSMRFNLGLLTAETGRLYREIDT